MKVMVDFFSGLKGASEYPKELGWQVITVDIEPKFKPDICQDILLQIDDLLPEDIYFCWFSPPCTEFSKSHMPWHEANIDMSLVLRCFELVQELQPKYWVIENVVGLQKYLGRALFHLGPFYFWGWIPEIKSNNNHYFKSKLFPSEDRSSLRAKIPYEVSKRIIDTIN